MSRITECIVFVGYASRQVHEAITSHVFAPGVESGREQRLKPIDMEGAGGYKGFGARVYAAAFNFVDADVIAEWFATLPVGPHDSLMIAADVEDGGNLLRGHNWTDWDAE